jgi:hypothetical protein
MSQQQASFWIVSCAMLPTLEPFLPPYSHRLYSPDDIVVWNASSICHIGLTEVVEGSFSEHSLLYLVLTWLLGEMLDVARNGPHRGKLHLLCQGW